MVLPQAMAWMQYWFRVLSLKFCGKSKEICGDISPVSPAFCMYVLSITFHPTNNQSEVINSTQCPVHFLYWWMSVTENFAAGKIQCWKKKPAWSGILIPCQYKPEVICLSQKGTSYSYFSSDWKLGSSWIRFYCITWILHDLCPASDLRRLSHLLWMSKPLQLHKGCNL